MVAFLFSFAVGLESCLTADVSVLRVIYVSMVELVEWIVSCIQVDREMLQWSRFQFAKMGMALLLMLRWCWGS